MDANQHEAARVGGADTGPLNVQGGTPNTGQPTTYIPPELRPEPRPEYVANSNTAGTYVPPQQGYAPMPPPQSAPISFVQRQNAVASRYGHRHHTPLIGPLLLIVAGVVFLLNNMGVLPWSVWSLLGRLWPLILIAVGVDLLFGRRNRFVPLAILVALFGVGTFLVYSNSNLGDYLSSNTSLVSQQLSVPLGGTRSAQVQLHPPAGSLNISGGAASGQLAEGTLEYFGNEPLAINSETRDDGAALLDIDTQSHSLNFGFFEDRHAKWNVQLSPAVPIELSVDSGSNNVTLDLSKVQLQDLDLDSGTGNTVVTLPDKISSGTSDPVEVSIDGGTGNIELYVPKDTAARLEIDSGIGNVHVDSIFQQGRSDATNNGGDNDDDDDVYTTSTYNSAQNANKISIKIDQGVGNVEVKSK